MKVLLRKCFFLIKVVAALVMSLDKDYREQMITGTHTKCWIEMFGDGEIR